MPKELTEEEIQALAEEQELKRQVLAELAQITDIQGHMRGNIDRMEREGTTDSPPLDSRSPENAGKTQYEIDQAILSEHEGKEVLLVTQYPDFFEAEEPEKI